MAKPRVIIMSGYGLNCETETKYAFEKAGGKATIVHVNDLIDGHFSLRDFQILAIPGGFSYGDDTGSGNAFAYKIKGKIWEDILKFVNRDTLTIGICNGFQIIANLGLLPGFDKKYGQRKLALVHNTSVRYTVRWVDLKTKNDSPWLNDIDEMMLPIAHGEGNFYVTKQDLDKLKKSQQIAAVYTRGEICKYQNLAKNPNGSIGEVAAVTDETGRILGIMPHPERAMFFTQLPNWTDVKEKLKRSGKKIPEEGPGIKLFKNSINYFSI